MLEQLPSVGRIVHFVNSDLLHLAALITFVDAEGQVDLQVFLPAGRKTSTLPRDDTRLARVPFDPTGQKCHTWHWPEYVRPVTPLPEKASE